MKSLYHYIITESIRKLGKNEKGVIVFDIDDTLLHSDPTVMKVYKREPGKPVKELSTEEYAKDPDTDDPEKKSWFDFSMFRDPKMVYKSIVEGTPIIKNLKIMDSYIEAGYHFCFLTARACEDTIKDAIAEFIRKKNPNTGALEKLQDEYKRSLSHAINDDSKGYEGKSDGERKANVLKKLIKEYDRVVFVDDDEKNIRSAKALRNELKLERNKFSIIKAWEPDK